MTSIVVLCTMATGDRNHRIHLQVPRYIAFDVHALLSSNTIVQVTDISQDRHFHKQTPAEP
jgi:hypothetical protein